MISKGLHEIPALLEFLVLLTLFLLESHANLSQINNALLSNHSNQWESLPDQLGIDDEINYLIAANDSSQPTPNTT